MKTILYFFLLVFSLPINQVFAQGSMKIESGGRVTVNGNLTIIPGIWVCGEPLIDTRDGKSYSTAIVGLQCWMTQNLNIGNMIIGESDQTNNSIIEKYCYNNEETNCNAYGGLYQWDEAMQYVTTPGTQGLCPPGWRLPTDEEFCFLSQFLDPDVICDYNWNGTSAGTAMKTTSGWNYGGNGTNWSGFSGLPGGMRASDATFVHSGFYGIFLTSTQYDSFATWIWSLSCFNTEVGHFAESKSAGLSIRCVQ